MPPYPIRPRRDADLGGVAGLLVASHHSDAYPVVLLPDLVAWSAGNDLIEAWVATDPDAEGAVIGHVALTDADPDDEPTGQWVHATGRPAGELAVVRRLVVYGGAQGTGTGRALLTTAVDAAHDRGRRPVLDMADNLDVAGRMYERAGFERIGAYDLDLTDYLPPGQDDVEIAGRRTRTLRVLTWVGPEVPDGL